ncbi:hypothetical protein [Pseudarthrobacter sp. B4EP4b]|uniref:YobI family P-loop NTPase n=1 Tax=Pseudarthrobacter sp. B4EP4b TaxID=2590664 RepID=UPI0015EF86ED|nr:hypothetical protein [Pseudarthrobacter sp. B4EP4b]
MLLTNLDILASRCCRPAVASSASPAKNAAPADEQGAISHAPGCGTVLLTRPGVEYFDPFLTPPDSGVQLVNILESELAKSGSEGPRNIALTGHYGSGKGSVLKEAQRVLEQDDVNVINL